MIAMPPPAHLAVVAESEGWHAADLRRAAAAAAMRFDRVSWGQLRALTGGEGQGVWVGEQRLDRLDALMPRSVGPTSLERVVLRMDALHHLESRGLCVINPASAIEVSVDKWRATQRMADAGLPVPPTAATQGARDGLAMFDALGGDVVLKPLFGAQGFGVVRVSDRVMAQRALAQLDRMGAVAYQQAYVEHGRSDLRLFVVGGAVVASMRRLGLDWRCNVALGGDAERVSPGAELKDLAIRAARACGAELAGVDILLREPDGQPFVIEVNASPGWRKLSQVTGVDVAAVTLRYVVELSHV
jgi:ribosomal protein S6--L-glutamate ligase